MDAPLKSLQELFQKDLDALRLGQSPANLYDPMHYIMGLGGKRLRPVLALMGASLYGDPAKALPQAMAIELFHNFSLIHDDIMDGAPLRRGQATVHEKWGDNIGILSGDGMLVKAYQYVACCEASLLPAVLQTFSQTALEVCEGQQLDMDFESMDTVELDQYVHMIQFKTSVLLGCAMKIGALVGGATSEDADALYQFALLLGTSFQMKDDYLDVYGDPEKFGKQVGGDILCNKKTLLWIEAQRRAIEQGVDFEKHVCLEGEAKVAAFQNMYKTLGVDAFALAEIDRYYQEALSALDQVHLPEEKLQPLRQFAHWLYTRES